MEPNYHCRHRCGGGYINRYFLGKLIFAKNTQKQVEDADQQAKKLVEDAKTHAETLKEKKILEAKEHFLQLKSEHEKEVFQRNQKLYEAENRHQAAAAEL